MDAKSRKYKLKTLFGDKYLQFMSDLNNISLTHNEISKKWNVKKRSLSVWINDLGYVHTGFIKMKLRNHYAIQKRVKERQEKMKKIISLLQK